MHECLFETIAQNCYVTEGYFSLQSPEHCRKITKISPATYIFEGLIFGGAYIRRGLSTKGNLHFKIDWANLIVGSKFTVFALFYFVFESNFPSTSPRGAYIWRGLYMEGLIFGILRYFNNLGPL